jgi:hypothetical protein
MKVNVIKVLLLIGVADTSMSMLAQSGPCSDPQINIAYNGCAPGAQRLRQIGGVRADPVLHP